MNPTEAPLEVDVVDGKLVISIGLDTLAFAIRECPDLQHEDEKTGEFLQPRIDNLEALGREMVLALCDEQEDGSTPVHRLLDQAAEKALESGAEGIYPAGMGVSS